MREIKRHWCTATDRWCLCYSAIEDVLIMGELVGFGGELYDDNTRIKLADNESVLVTYKDKSVTIRPVTLDQTQAFIEYDNPAGTLDTKTTNPQLK